MNSQALLFDCNKIRAFFVNKYKKSIDKYINDRKNKFYLKDFLNDEDKKTREKYLEELKTNLDEYMLTGTRQRYIRSVRQR